MLSPDAELPLTEVDMSPGHVFCIGGVVDRSVRKGLTLSVLFCLVANKLSILRSTWGQ